MHSLSRYTRPVRGERGGFLRAAPARHHDYRAARAALAVAAIIALVIAFPVSADPAPAATPAAVSYYRAENVAKSFAQGAVLFDRGTNYMIHTSRRVAPGMAEVHTRDTDLIYVLEGEATFVTGGRIVDGRPTADGEIRGASIVDGETRTLARGDVIIVPAGTPHWFKDVRGPVLYYTVKVR